MQSDVRHVLPPPENVAWPYTESTCANSQPYSPSFHFSLFPSSSFLLCDRFQQAQPDMKTLCTGSTRGRLSIPYGPHVSNPWDQRARKRAERTDQTQLDWEHTGLAQEEDSSNCSVPPGPMAHGDRPGEGQIRVQLSTQTLWDALKCCWAEPEGARAAWGWSPGLAPIQKQVKIGAKTWSKGLFSSLTRNK